MGKDGRQEADRYEQEGREVGEMESVQERMERLEVFNYDCLGQLSFIEPDFIKDADCTVRTPVIRGGKESPVYGQGKRIKPRLLGRTGSKHFEQIYLPELLPLEENDLNSRQRAAHIRDGGVLAILKQQYRTALLPTWTRQGKTLRY